MAHRLFVRWEKLVGVAAVACLSLALASGAHASEEAERAFTVEVLPLLKQKCLGCHGGAADDIKGGLSVANRDALLQGGESGEPAIVPGASDLGTLLAAVRWDGLEMPPKENDRLTGEQIAAIERWVEAGAPWPDDAALARYREDAKADGAADGVIVATSGGLSDDWTFRRYQPEDLWAFAPVQKLSAEDQRTHADGRSRDRANNQHQLATEVAVIDALIAEPLAAAGIEPAERADARTRIRRATFDLHGLPPTPDEVEAFVAASEVNAEAAWEALIERLLASPRYGERWGQHWLDVTRYADTGGMSNDFERSNMWRYRDYVIRAFNSDKPYNDFIVEQIAGDELADQSVRERTDGSEAEVHRAQQTGAYSEREAEWLVASGFLRLGPWDNAMVEQDEARQIWLDDVVNITGQAFLSTTMRCVKCHDHKFDPIPTRDYYRMYAAFATTHMAERSVPFLANESQAGFEEGRAHAQRMLNFAVTEKSRLVEKREAAARAWFDEHQLPYRDENERKDLPDEEKPPRHVGLDHVEQGQLKVREQDEWIWTRRLERYEPMAQSVYNAADFTLAWNGARKLRIKRDKKQPAEAKASFILLGGAVTAPGEEVGPGVLSAVPVAASTDSDDPYLLDDAIAGRRRGLAEWIANPANPLTTRSIVNRVWQGHFGTGLAANGNNFGAKGARPTHPKLLDFLAANFVDHGWTIKRLHRMIMLTEVYQRASSAPDTDAWQTVDPDNRLLSHFPRRRLSAEEIRDGILLVTGELQERSGGLPIMPEINQEVALEPRMIQFSIAPAYQPSPTPAERNGRSVYAYRVRGQADPFCELFNQPNPNESCDLRESAAVTPQVFTLLNSDQMTDRSIAFALRLEQERDTRMAQIDRGFELAFGRHPSDAERSRLGAYLEEMQAYHRDHPPAAREYPTEITRSLVEEFTGEPFEYQEILPVFERYQPDTGAADVAPGTRALADVCLLLLNTNEFLYVD